MAIPSHLTEKTHPFIKMINLSLPSCPIPLRRLCLVGTTDQQAHNPSHNFMRVESSGTFYRPIRNKTFIHSENEYGLKCKVNRGSNAVLKKNSDHHVILYRPLFGSWQRLAECLHPQHPVHRDDINFTPLMQSMISIVDSITKTRDNPICCQHYSYFLWENVTSGYVVYHINTRARFYKRKNYKMDWTLRSIDWIIDSGLQRQGMPLPLPPEILVPVALTRCR